MFGGKQTGLHMKRATWIVTFDKNRALRKQNGASWGQQRKVGMEVKKYHEQKERI